MRLPDVSPRVFTWSAFIVGYLLIDDLDTMINLDDNIKVKELIKRNS